MSCYIKSQNSRCAGVLVVANLLWRDAVVKSHVSKTVKKNAAIIHVDTEAATKSTL